MFNNKKTVWIIVGGAFVLALAVGAVALASVSVASAQEASLNRGLNIQLSRAALGTDVDGGFAHRGGGFPGRGLGDNTYLAEALGISVEELEAAQETARVEAIDQALAEGLITEAQAEALKDRSFGFGGRGTMFGGFLVDPDAIDHEALLAEALGISVEELQAAHEKAAELALQARIDSGDLSEEQAELLKARQALKDYIDPQALFSEVTGMTAEEYREAHQAAYEAAIQQAVVDGVITQEVADQILSEGIGMGRGLLPGFDAMPGGMPHRPGGPGMFKGFPGNPETVTPDSDV